MPFDLEGARKAGATDQQIAAHLAQTFNYDMDAAIKQGATPTQIADFLSTHERPTPAPESNTIKRSLGQKLLHIPAAAASDVVDVAKGIGTAVAHPVQTVSALKDFVGGAAQGAREAVGLPPVAQNVFTGQPQATPDQAAREKTTFAPAKQVIAENVKDPRGIPGRAVDYALEHPVKAAMDVSGAGSAARKTFEAARLARAAQAAGAVEKYANPVALAAKGAEKVAEPVAKATGRVVTEVLGSTTGAGRGAIQEAIAGGPAFEKAMRGGITGEEVVDQARGALQTIRDNRATAYRAKLADVSANKEPIDLKDLKTQVTENLKKFVRYNEPKAVTATMESEAAPAARAVRHPNPGQMAWAVETKPGEYVREAGAIKTYPTEEAAVSAAAKTAPVKTPAAKTPTRPGSFDWSRTSVGGLKQTNKGWTGSGPAKELKDAYDQIMSWGSKPEDATPMGLDMLKRNLDQFYSDKSDIRAFVASARDRVKSLIVKNVPEYAEMTKGYSEASGLIKDIESNLMLRNEGMSGRITADNTLRRLTSAMRENFEMRKDLLDALSNEGARDVTGTVAGYAMNQAIPHGLVGKLGSGGALVYLNPKMWPLVAAASPRVVGEFMNVYGKAIRAAAPAGRAISKAARAANTPASANILYQTGRLQQSAPEGAQ